MAVRPRSLTLALFTAFAALGAAQNVPVEKYRLANGMTVILRPDHSIPLATVNIWYKVGSKDEPPRHSGFAHLFEHLMFMGTRRVPTGQYDKIMEGGGGNNNASTAEDRTNYFDVGPANLLPTLLWLEADRLEELGKSMTLKKLNLQREVVKNERRQNTENTPYGSAYEAVNGLMFPPGHPYHTSVIGSMADLDRASVADVQKFFATYYVPNNASMVVAGDFDPSKIKPMIAHLFGTLSRKPPVPRKPDTPLTYLGVKRLTMKDKVAAPKVIMVWHAPAAYKPGDAEMQLAGSVLSSGLTSRLYQRLVVKDKLATDVSAFEEQRLLGSLFYVDTTATQGADLKKLEAAVDAELQKFRAGGPTKAELKRQSAKIESGTLNGLQSIQNVADALNDYEFYLGKPNSFKEELDRFRNATPSQVRTVASKVLNPNNRVILTVVPGAKVGAQPTSGGSAPLSFKEYVLAQRKGPRDQRPAVGKQKPYVAPAPTVLKLANGMSLYYWQKTELPLMTLTLNLRVGAASESSDKGGVSALTAGLLDQGAGKLGANAFQDQLDQLGASVGASAGRTATTVSLNVLSPNFAPALKLYADAVLRPRFPVSEFERVKRVTIAGLQQQQDDVNAVSSLVAAREYFGDSNPYGRPVSGTEKTVGAVGLGDVKETWRKDYQPILGTFYGAGSLPAKEVARQLNALFGSWKNRAEKPMKPEFHSMGMLHEEAGPRLVIVDKPGAPQTAVRFMAPAPDYGSPDRLRLEEIGTILGGSFTSRLNQNLREDKGYTYGASARFANDRHVGYLVAAAQVRADVTGASIKEFLAEFDRIQKGDISAGETSKATASIRAETIDVLGSIQGLVGSAVSLAGVDRPFTALSQDDKALGAITASQLNAVVKAQIRYKAGVLVLVGDKATILPQLKSLNLPEPVIVKP
jgi:predicted Zn-dependent peptidase